MAFDQNTRNRLQRFVGEARTLLAEEFNRQLQHVYGMDPESGVVSPLEDLRHLDDARLETARVLRDTLSHYLATSPSGGNREALERIVREQAFTVLNRLAALRMAEAREFLIESVGNGYSSKGFQLYARLAGTGLGETGDAYCSYLFSLFDEFALDLKVLFDRFSPYGRLFPREAALLELLALINDADIAPLWAEDETIGWIYQYFNSKEERKKMRDESSAPRNSRELAVRNQFFTPRYVVEFLTDNTLGRIWHEMMRGETRLKETCRYLVRRPNEVFLEIGASPPDGEETAEQNLTQEELLRQPVHIPHRPLKDPRMIRVLDPACGSMHFGLYAYDLLEVIYEEAWDLEAARGAGVFSREMGLRPLHEEYADREAFLRDVPRLIIEHNLHGIDIDPRAAQIAGLSLWLRAQRAWQDQKVKPAERPQIRRSNIVCAEPMPGEETLLKEFVDKNLAATPELRLLGQLVRHIFDAMKLAGEAGSLLKIETEIADAVAEAKRKWLEVPMPKQDSLFAEMARPEQQRLGYEVAGITDEAFWERAEQLIYGALQSYAEQSENGGGYQRRLFADDAARGFAFIDLCRKRYDVVLMNPPFGESVGTTSSYLNEMFSAANHDLAIAMVQRWVGKLDSLGSLGAITTRTPLYNSSSQLWRKEILISKNALFTCLDLGGGVLDAMVETSAYVIDSGKYNKTTLFFRLTTASPEQKGPLAESSIGDVRYGTTAPVAFIKQMEEFEPLPNSPLAYWIHTSLVTCFKTLPPLKESGAEAWVGLQTSYDERFLRLWWELPLSQSWKPFAKGGEASPYFADIHLTVNWADDGQEMKAYHDYLNFLGKSTPGNGPRRDFPFYYEPGLTWVYRTDRFHVQPLPAGCITSTRGPGIYSEKRRGFLLGYLNSAIADALIKVLLGKHTQPQFDIDDVNALPTPTADDSQLEELGLLAWGVRCRLIRTLEEYIGCHHGLLYTETTETTLKSQYVAAQIIRDQSLGQLSNIQNQIDDRARRIVGITERDYLELADTLYCWDNFGIIHEDQFGYVHRCISYELGCILGRWDIRFGTGEKPVPELPDPFAPLPLYPPGMLQNEQRPPAAQSDVPASYPLRVTWPGILVDDAGHAEDLESRLREGLQVIWQEHADAIEQEACEILGVRSLREYFRKPNLFFADHLKRYSKSRRQAPIYWPLATPSGSYTLWLYYHRLDAQTLYRCVVDFVEPKLRQTNDALGQLRAKANRARDEERELERLQDFALELQAFRDELLRLAQLPWRPNLNDGVQITAAPLWKLFRLPKWQKTLKDTWQELEKGKYDWAHLAMTIWPERVVPKCTQDRSLAIAHGLEDLFWVEDLDHWRKLRKPEQEIEEQKQRQRSDARTRVKFLLAKMAADDGQDMSGDAARRHLAEGKWDDREVALLLYPQRVAEKCWDDPVLARKLNVKLPTKRTKASLQQFMKKLIASCCPDLASQVEAALSGRNEPFSVFWGELERGDHDHLDIALSLWPDRVIDKCTLDLNLAEHHAVRKFFWCQHPTETWRRRDDPDVEVANEIDRRRGRVLTHAD